MSNAVQFNMEKMVSELKNYKDLGIFGEDEIKNIIERRRMHEYRLQNSRKRAIDYIRYIEYQIDLEAQKDGIKSTKAIKEDSFDEMLSNSIIYVFKKALKNFPTDINILIMFTNYAIKKQCYDDLRLVFGEFCLRNIRDIDLWIFCCSKLIEIGDFQSARLLIQKGIKINSKSKKIRLEYFKMEILYMDNLLSINQEMEINDEEFDDIEKGLIPFLIFEDLYKIDPKCSELKQMVNISAKYKILNQRLEEFLMNQGSLDINYTGQVKNVF